MKARLEAHRPTVTLPAATESPRTRITAVVERPSERRPNAKQGRSVGSAGYGGAGAGAATGARRLTAQSALFAGAAVKRRSLAQIQREFGHGHPTTQVNAFVGIQFSSLRQAFDGLRDGTLEKTVDGGARTVENDLHALKAAVQAYRLTPAYTDTAYQGHGVRLEREFLEARGFYGSFSDLRDAISEKRPSYVSESIGAVSNPVHQTVTTMAAKAKSDRAYGRLLDGVLDNPITMMMLLDRADRSPARGRPNATERELAKDLLDLLDRSGKVSSGKLEHSPSGLPPLDRRPGINNDARRACDELEQLHRFDPKNARLLEAAKALSWKKPIFGD